MKKKNVIVIGVVLVLVCSIGFWFVQKKQKENLFFESHKNGESVVQQTKYIGKNSGNKMSLILDDLDIKHKRGRFGDFTILNIVFFDDLGIRYWVYPDNSIADNKITLGCDPQESVSIEFDLLSDGRTENFEILQDGKSVAYTEKEKDMYIEKTIEVYQDFLNELYHEK